MVKALGYLEPSGRYFFFKNKKVANLKDIAGLKIRVQTNDLATKMVSSLGASATPISYKNYIVRCRLALLTEQIIR